MSILTNKTRKVNDLPIDEIYVIYGDAGTGKTVLASTFPKSEQEPMLYLDFLEGGTGSISVTERDFIDVVEINNYKDLSDVLDDVIKGETVDDNGNVKKIKYSTIVFDSATQLEYLMKQALMDNSNKGSMTLQLWGQARQEHDQLWNVMKYLHKTTGSRVVAICHKKEVTDEENPGNNKIIPSLMNAAAYQLCAKASFVWYTKIERDQVVDAATNEVKDIQNYVTYIDACQSYLTKTRRPKEMSIPLKIKNLTYPKFKKNILDKL